jgi:hypothetical protein
VCRSRSCIISALETFSGVGLHALVTGAPGAAASEPLAVEPLAAVGPSRVPFHEGHGCSIPQKQLLNIARMQGFGFLWSRRPVEGHFSTTHSDRIYTYSYGKTVYIRIIRRIYTPAKIHIRCIRIRVRRKFIYTYVYIRYVYIRRIYTYTVWANPSYLLFDEAYM